jgi:hypothetical protein
MTWLVRHLIIACIGGLTLLAPFQPASRAQNLPSTGAVCWASEALAGKPGEKEFIGFRTTSRSSQPENPLVFLLYRKTGAVRSAA